MKPKAVSLLRDTANRVTENIPAKLLDSPTSPTENDPAAGDGDVISNDNAFRLEHVARYLKYTGQLMLHTVWVYFIDVAK
jgi:hypothetical protein